MPKKTTILIIVLVLFTAGLIYIAVKTEQQVPPKVPSETITEEEALNLIPTINPQTQISFSPAVLNIFENPQTSYSVDVAVNTNGQSISGIQLELSYDPEILTDFTINPAKNNLFGQNPVVLINSVDPELGRASLAIALGGITADEVSGTGNIATVTFSTNSTKKLSTQISILPKTTVRSLQSTNSLLQNATPLNIILSATPAGSGLNPTLPPTDSQLQ